MEYLSDNVVALLEQECHQTIENIELNSINFKSKVSKYPAIKICFRKDIKYNIYCIIASLIISALFLWKMFSQIQLNFSKKLTFSTSLCQM